MRNLIIFSCLTILLTTSCQQSDQNNAETTETTADTVIQAPERVQLRYGEADTAQIAQWLTNSILKDDLDFLKSEQRNYQLDAYDLDNDGNLEYFVGFTNDYFCGSGGCTYYLLGHDGEVISLFSVSRAPFYILESKTNGWHDLVINSNSGMRKLSYDGASYPENPSVLPAFEDSTSHSDAVAILKDAKSYSF
ncbi:hypothetical protein [Albibacterium indicum]|uniref:hypothetical protein n=1 Tax=Albibacterium indicum TaxID=2292082 RepID=UPI000E4B3812|nr:hypothetical protein [Pedobacter indicus]